MKSTTDHGVVLKAMRISSPTAVLIAPASSVGSERPQQFPAGGPALDEP